MSDFQTVNKKGNPSVKAAPSSAKKYGEQQQKLIEMGFDPHAVIKALEQSLGDIAAATVILLDDESSNNPEPVKVEEKQTPTTNVRNGSQPAASRNATNNIKKESEKDITENHHRMMATYKILKCKEGPTHDRKMCMYYHSQSDRRRNPFENNYSCYECPNTAAGNECKDEDACPHAHTMLERMFHPELYKISMCQRIHTSQKCDRGLLCAFAHSEIDLRVSPSTAKLIDPVDGKPIKRQVPNTPTFNKMLEKLVKIIREAGPDGVIAADLPKKYILQYTESLDLVDEKGEKYRVRDLLALHPAVEVILQKGQQPKYIFDESKSTDAPTEVVKPVVITAAAIVAGTASTSSIPSAASTTPATPAPSKPTPPAPVSAVVAAPATTSNNNNKAETSVKQRLITLIKAAGKEGILGSDLPKKYLEVYGEKLEMIDDAGGKMKLKDMIPPQMGIATQQLKLQPKYVYDPSLVNNHSSTTNSNRNNSNSNHVAVESATPSPATTTTATTTNSSPKPFSYSAAVVTGKSYSAVAAALRSPPTTTTSAPAAPVAAPVVETVQKPTTPAAAPVVEEEVTVAVPETQEEQPVEVEAATLIADEDAPSAEDPVFQAPDLDPVDQLIDDGDNENDALELAGEEMVAEITSSFTNATFESSLRLDDFNRKSDVVNVNNPPLMMGAPGLTKLTRPTSNSITDNNNNNNNGSSLSNLIASITSSGPVPGASTIADYSERLTVAQTQMNQLQSQINKLQNELTLKNNDYETQSLQLRNMMQRLAEAESKSNNDEHFKAQLKTKEEEIVLKSREVVKSEDDLRKQREERILDLNQFYVIMSQIEDAMTNMKCKEDTFPDKLHGEDVQELLQFRKALKTYVQSIKLQLKAKFDVIATNNNNNNNSNNTIPSASTVSSTATVNNNNNNNNNNKPEVVASRYATAVNNVVPPSYEQSYYGANAYHGTQATQCAYLGCRAEGIYTCAGCQKVSYCGAEHQRLDWTRHSAHCNL